MLYYSSTLMYYEITSLSSTVIILGIIIIYDSATYSGNISIQLTIISLISTVTETIIEY